MGADNGRRDLAILRASLTCTARAREAVGYLGMADRHPGNRRRRDQRLRRRKKRPDGSKFLAFDGEHVQRSLLRVDTRKWLLAKALPKI